MPADRSVADLVAGFLADRGVRRVYGVPGGEVLALLDALGARGIKFVLTHHEAAAAYMADTEGQLTGRPGVCLSTLGPGAANLLPGLAQATLERSPVLGLTADVTPTEAAERTHQVLNLPDALRPLVKFSARLTAAGVWDTLPRAWHAATAGRPGAAHVAIPPSVAVAPAPPGSWSITAEAGSQVPNGADIDRLRSRLLAAARPVAVLGLEGRNDATAAAFRELVEMFDLPVVTQIKAKGWFPGDHALHAGTLAAHGSRGVIRLLREADLIVGVGLDGVDLIGPWPAGEVTLIAGHAEPDPTFPHTRIVGPPAEALAQLADAPRPRHSGRGAARAAHARAAARDDLSGAARAGSDPADAPARALPIHQVFAPLRAALGADVALISDVGFHKLYLAQHWTVPRPRGYLVPNGLSAMGWALASAMAYKLTLPERPVLAVIGDGGLLMCAGELATLARLRPPGLVLAILHDASLALIHAKAEELALDVRPTDFAAPDFVALGRSFGLPSERARSSTDAVDLIVAGLHADAPRVVEIPLAYAAYRQLR